MKGDYLARCTERIIRATQCCLETPCRVFRSSLQVYGHLGRTMDAGLRYLVLSSAVLALKLLLIPLLQYFFSPTRWKDGNT